MNSLKIDHIPNQEGKIAIVTGANSGLGFETTKELVKKVSWLLWLAEI